MNTDEIFERGYIRAKVWGPCIEAKEINGVLVPQGKASTLPTDHLITGLPAKLKWFKPNHPYMLALLVYLIG